MMSAKEIQSVLSVGEEQTRNRQLQSQPDPDLLPLALLPVALAPQVFNFLHLLPSCLHFLPLLA